MCELLAQGNHLDAPQQYADACLMVVVGRQALVALNLFQRELYLGTRFLLRVSHQYLQGIVHLARDFGRARCGLVGPPSLGTALRSSFRICRNLFLRN
ncbi:hypothetical protein D9M68_720630 [compost metagenome]